MKGKVSIFSSGKLISIGTVSEAESYEDLKRIISLARAKFLTTKTDFLDCLGSEKVL
jgi:predicted nucleic-acid-binding protein